MSDPSPIPQPFAPPTPVSPAPQPVVSIPPPPSQVRRASSAAAWDVGATETAPAGQPGVGPFTLAGGTRRRRLGTVSLLVIVVVAGLVGVGVATGNIRLFGPSSTDQSSDGFASPLGRTSGGRLEGSGITFRYPRTWQPLSDVHFSLSSGEAPSRGIVLQPPPPGPDDESNVIVATYVLPSSDEGASEATLRSYVNGLLADLAGQGARVERAVSDGRLGALPAFLATIDSRVPDGPILQTRMFVAFDGTTEYFVACQSTPDARAVIGEGCRQIVRSFHVSEASG